MTLQRLAGGIPSASKLHPVEYVTKVEALDALTEELARFCKDNGLEYKSACDLVWDTSITQVQRNYLLDYIKRWEAAAAAEYEAHMQAGEA